MLDTHITRVYTPPMILKTCAFKECKLPFHPTRQWQRFHQQACHDRHHNLRKQAVLKQARQKGKKP